MGEFMKTHWYIEVKLLEQDGLDQVIIEQVFQLNCIGVPEGIHITKFCDYSRSIGKVNKNVLSDNIMCKILYCKCFWWTTLATHTYFVCIRRHVKRKSYIIISRYKQVKRCHVNQLWYSHRSYYQSWIYHRQFCQNLISGRKKGRNLLVKCSVWQMKLLYWEECCAMNMIFGKDWITQKLIAVEPRKERNRFFWFLRVVVERDGHRKVRYCFTLCVKK